MVPYKCGITETFQNLTKMSDNDIYSDLKGIRTQDDFVRFTEDWFKTSHPLCRTINVHQNVWNRMYVLIGQGKLKHSGKATIGEVVMEIEHAMGILILINESYTK